MKCIHFLLFSVLILSLYSFESSNRMTKNEIIAKQGVFATMPSDFDFDYKWNVISYEWVVKTKSDLYSGKANGSKYPDQLVSILKNTTANDIFVIENVIIEGSSGERRKMQGFSVVIK